MKIIVFNEKALEKRFTPIVRQQLNKELGKNPSNQQIFNRVRFYINSRDLTMLFSGLAIIIIGILFQRF